jgi:multiple sugar transport system ATP-binding protein
MVPALELAQLVKRFGSITAVDRIDLAVPPGELVALLGPSGCGKATTLRIVAGFERPDSGCVRIQGDDVTAEPPYRRDTGMVFQHYALFPHMTVRENVGFGLRMRGVDRGEIETRVHEALALVSLGGLEGRFPRQLSGGQQQRVALARALVIRPKLLLLDEPLSSLDAKLRQEMRLEVRAIQRRVGITALFVTHDQEEALSLADRIAVMKDGVIQQIGTPYEIYDSPANVFVADFVGEPAINLLPGTVADGGRARLSDSVQLTLPVPVAEGREVVVGVRPEDLHLTGEDGLPARVVAHEPLLEAGVATLALDGVERPLVVLTGPEVRLAHDEPVRVAADTRLTHVFDAETGDTLR